MAGTFTYTIDWADGTPAVTVDGPADPPITHTYIAPGTYTMSATATDPRCGPATTSRHHHRHPATGRSRVGEDGDDSTPNVGETVTFTVTSSNTGPDDGHRCGGHRPAARRADVRVGHPEPGDLHPGDGGCGPSGRSPPVLRDAAADRHRRLARPATNTRHRHRSDQVDPDTANNTAAATVTPQTADLALTKTVSDPTPNVGDTVTFTVTDQHRPRRCHRCRVTDLLPAGLTFVSATPSQGTYTRRPVCGRSGRRRRRAADAPIWCHGRLA